MRIVLIGLAMTLLTPSVAQGWGWSSGAKKWSNSANKPTSSSYGNSNSSYKNETPQWKQRYDNRRKRQWDKPGGVNFPTPSRRTRPVVVKNKFLLQHHQQKNEQAIAELKKKKEREQQARKERERRRLNRSLFQRFRNAWKAMWKNRTVKAEREAPFATTGGFGAGIHRAVPGVIMSWRLRRDSRRRSLRGPRRPLRRRTVPMM